MDPTASRQATLERRARRERAARMEAERLLTEKSRELYDALRQAGEAREQLELALWASGKRMWEWHVADDTVRSDALPLIDPSFAREGMHLQQELVPRVHPDDREAVTIAWRLAMLNREPLSVEFRLRGSDGYHRLRLRGRLIKRGSGRSRALVMLGTVKDVSARCDEQQQQRIIANALAVAREPIAIAMLDWRLLQANEAFTALTGLAPTDLRARLTDRLPLPRVLQQAPAGPGGVRRGRLTMRNNTDEAERELEASVTPLTNGAGEITHYIVNLRPISEERGTSALKLMKMSTLDAATGLPNRATMTVHLDARTGLLRDTDTFAVMLIALSEWRQLAGAFGKEAVESQLSRCVRQIEQDLHPQDVLGRWADDVLILVMRPDTSAAHADRLARSVIAVFNAPHEIDGLPVTIPVNIGIALAPSDGDDSETLVRRADSATYAAKKLGHNALEFFRAALDVDGFTRLHMLTLLRGARQRNEFEFVVQPKVNESREVVGGEMLMRWHSGHYGPVSPEMFIPLAEESDQIVELGSLAALEAAQLTALMQQTGHEIPIAVNVSGRQMSTPGLEFMLLAACEKAGIEPWMLELELTESVLLEQLTDARELIQRLRAHGFRLSLDDFGTGYSSLTYLRELPFDRVKIDRSFVRDICDDVRARALLGGIVTMCRALGISTVAEGIETQAQFDLLRSLGVDEYQGFWFYRPMAFSDMLALVHPAGGEAGPGQA